MATTIRTAYKSYPNSNVGQIIATAAGRQAMRRVDQSQSSGRPITDGRGVRLADRLGVRVVAEVESNDAGTVRRFSVVD